MLTEKDYCDYETCVALKELGYIGQGRCYYDLDKYKNQLRHFGIQVLTTRSAKALNFVLAVHLYEAQKWLREEKKLHITIFSQSQESWQYRITTPHQKLEDGLHGEDFSSFEEALSEGVRNAVEILKEK